MNGKGPDVHLYPGPVIVVTIPGAPTNRLVGLLWTKTDDHVYCSPPEAVLAAYALLSAHVTGERPEGMRLPFTIDAEDGGGSVTVTSPSGTAQTLEGARARLLALSLAAAASATGPYLTEGALIAAHNAIT